MPDNSPADASATQTRLPLGRPIQAAAGTLIVSASRVRDFAICPRRFFLAHVLRVPAPERDSDASFQGRAIHRELFLRHENPECHDAENLVADDIAPDLSIMHRMRSHWHLCPGSNDKHAEYLGGEVDLRWLIRSKNVLLTGRADALWQYLDNTLEIRDYKSGHCPDSLDDDFPAAIYLLLAASHPRRPPRVRVTYERLGPSPSIVGLEGTPQRIARAISSVKDFADTVRRERQFAATPTSEHCKACAYADLCPSSMASDIQ